MAWRKATPEEVAAAEGYDVTDREQPWWLIPGAKEPPAAAEPAPEMEGAGENPQDVAAELAHKQTSAAEASLRGAGSAFPLVDEVSGAVRALSENRDIRNLPQEYRGKRDEERQRTAAASEEHPTAFYGSQAAGYLGTALIPGANVLKAASPGVRGLALGATYGLGASEADLTKGEVVPALVDTAKGAVIGGATAKALKGVQSWISKAPERAEQAEVGNLLLGTKGTTRTKATGLRGENVPEIREKLRAEPQIRRDIKDAPLMALEQVEQKKLAPMGERMDKIIEKAQEVTPGVPFVKIAKGLDALATEYESAEATKHLGAEVRKIIAGMHDRYKSGTVVKGAPQVPLSAARNEYRRFQDVGFQGGQQFSTPAGKQLDRDVANIIRGELHAEIERVTARNPSIGSIAEVKQLNKDMSTWFRVRDVLEEKTARGIAGAPTIGKMIDQAGKMSAAGALKSMVGAMMGDIAEPADRALAKLVTKARGGDAAAAGKVAAIYKAAGFTIPNIGAQAGTIKAATALPTMSARRQPAWAENEEP